MTKNTSLLLVFLLALLMVVTAPVSFNCLAAETAAGSNGVELTASGPAADFDVGVKAAFAEVTMTVTAVSPDTDWGEKDAESAVLKVKLDGEFSQNIVLFMGQTQFDYRVMLGRLAAGKHKITFSFEQWKSSPEAQKVLVKAVNFQQYSEADANYLVYKYAPIFYGREVNNYSDVPLYEWHEISRDQDGRTTIQYSVNWTNEDSRNDTNGIGSLMCDWGRATDIEWIYKVVLDKTGKIVEERFQAPGHEHNEFTGTKVDAHPVLYTTTLNNNMSLSGNNKFCFFYDPSWTLPGGNLSIPAESSPRELLMDANGWTYAIMAKELEREGKIEDQSDPDTIAVGDLRNYIYLGYQTKAPNDQLSYGSGYNSHKYLVHHVAVQLKDDPQWYSNDHNGQLKGKGKDGWARTTIEVPDGTKPEDIVKLKFAIRPIKPEFKKYELKLTDIKPVLMLDENYMPLKSIFEMADTINLDQDHPETVFVIKK